MRFGLCCKKKIQAVYLYADFFIDICASNHENNFFIMIQLKNRWVLITGASRGIGRLCAMYMAKMGCNLILHSRSVAHTESLVKQVEDLGVKAYAVQADLADPSSVAQMLQTVDDMGVDVDVVLNNAGLQVTYRNNYFETPSVDFDTSFRINTVAPMMICYHFLPKMKARGFGRIVNTSSGINLEPQQAPYSASKAALDKVTRDLGSTIDGTDVCISLADPGWCRTDLGGPSAPNSPESALPGVLIGAFIDDLKSGRWFSAQDFSGMDMKSAVEKAQSSVPSPYLAQ